MKDVIIGSKGIAETVVSENNTAAAVGSGSLEVFATPAMTALMEKAACKAVEAFVEDGETTVGTELCVSHSSATPVGMNVRAEAAVTAVNGREICFDVRAYDECGEIGSGTHKRFLVFSEKFMDKTRAKAKK